MVYKKKKKQKQNNNTKKKTHDVLESVSRGNAFSFKTFLRILFFRF